MRWWLAISCVLVVGCLDGRALAPIEPCDRVANEEGWTLRNFEPVQTPTVIDVLIVVDAGPSTAAARAALGAALVPFLDGLASGDVDHDGRAEATPMQSIHVAVVHSDIDAGVHPASDGWLALGGGVLRYDVGAETSIADVARAAAGAIHSAPQVAIGPSQPLRAIAEALAIGRRAGGAVPWATNVPDGFPQSYDSELVVLVVTDQDDGAEVGAVDSFDSIVETLSLRADREMIALGVVANVPLALAGRPPADVLAVAGAPSPLLALGDRILRDDGDVVIGSIDAPDDTSVLATVSADVVGCVAAPATSCLPRMQRNASGLLDCDVLEALRDDATIVHCAELAPSGAYELDHIEEWFDGSTHHRFEVCRMRQIDAAHVGDPNAAGWFYDDGTFGSASHVRPACDATITLQGTSFVVGAGVGVRCSDSVVRAESNVPALGAVCDPASDQLVGGGGRCADARPRCDPFARTCGVPCIVDSDCWAAGDPTYACDRTLAGDVFAAGNLPYGTTATTPRGFCVSPTCGE
jgi:hypothetical protein